MKKKTALSKGFTLIELMIVVAIIGILSSVAIPSFMRFRIKSIRAEAHLILGDIYNSEISFFATNGYYNVSLYQVGISIGHPPNANNLFCMEGATVVCGKYYAGYVPYSSESRFMGIVEGWPDTSVPGGYDRFIVHGP